jgi:hypothetical protein
MSHQVQGKPSLLDYLCPFHPQSVDQVVVHVLVNLHIVKSSLRASQFHPKRRGPKILSNPGDTSSCGYTWGGSEPFSPF